MKKFVAALALGAVMSFATTAFAADVTATIKTISIPDRLVTLDDGKIYVFTAAVDLTKVKVGDKVKVTYTPATGPAADLLHIFGSGTAMAPAT